MPGDDKYDDSLRAWSMENSLFSGRTGSTTATQRSQSSQKLEIVPELESSENLPVAAEPIAISQEPEMMPTSGSIATTQPVPVPASTPLRPSTYHFHQQPKPAPSVTSGAKLFGNPNMKVPIDQPVSKPPSLGPSATREVLEDVETAVVRLYESVLSDSRPSFLVTRAASAAQRIQDCCSRVETGQVTTANCEALVKIIKTVLGFSDVLLRSSSHRSSRLSLLRSLECLGVALGLIESDQNATVPLPRNFALGNVIYQDTCDSLLKNLSSTPISDQEGSYIAPVCRGLGPDFSVATLCIGIPYVNETHWQQVITLAQVCPEIHFYVRGDCILPAQQRPPRVVPPFRTPDHQRPPMSISLAPSSATHTSGTLGGYIYPVIDESNSQFAQFKNSTFALTCGHVCLCDDDASRNIDKPVLTPSPVLVSLFRKALEKEAKLHSPNSFEHRAYYQAMLDLEHKPPKSLGSLVWGERDLVTTKQGQFMSDLAIICCDPSITCRNELGDDVDLAQYDLGLTFERTVTHVIPTETLAGLDVFKYGATSKLTQGRVSASRIIYWSSNRLQSTEFVVRSESPVFASGGDSGAWVLARGIQTGQAGLGVAGMIHSYDGEFKEFGLFTPISSVLDRLEQVTSVPWAVVGVPGQGDIDTYGSSA